MDFRVDFAGLKRCVLFLLVVVFTVMGISAQAETLYYLHLGNGGFDKVLEENGVQPWSANGSDWAVIVNDRLLGLLEESGATYEIVKVYGEGPARRAVFEEAAKETPTLENEYIELFCNSENAFTMRRASDEKWLLYPSTGTTTISFCVDESIYASRDVLSGTGGLTVVDAESAYVDYLTEDDVALRLWYILNGEAVRLMVEATNNDSQAHDVAVRFLLDTQVDTNDGSPLYAQGVTDSQGSSICTYEVDIPAVSFSEWKGYDIWPNPGLVTLGTLSAPPERMVFAWWPAAVDTTWDYSVDTQQRFYTPGYESSPKSDSCVLLYLDVGELAPSETEDVSTYYGVGAPLETIGREQFVTAAETLGAKYSDFVDFNCREGAALAAKGLAKAQSAVDADTAQTAIGFGCAIIGFVFNPTASADEIVQTFGLGARAANAVKALDFAGKAFDIKSVLDLPATVAFNKSIVSASFEEWYAMHQEDLLRHWGEERISSELYRFLWLDAEWAEPGVGYGSGMKSFSEAISDELAYWATEQVSSVDEGYPFYEAAEKMLSVGRGFDKARVLTLMLVWLNANGYEFELSPFKTMREQLDTAISEYEDAEFWSWVGTTASVLLLGGKIVLTPFTLGGSTAALVAEVCIMGSSVALSVGQVYHDFVNEGPAEIKIVARAGEIFINTPAQITSSLGAIQELQGYLSGVNATLLNADAALDNTGVEITDFNVDDMELPDGAESMTLSERQVHFEARNRSGTAVPVKPHTIFYAKSPDGSVAGPIQILASGAAEFVGTTRVNLDFNTAQLVPQEQIGAEFYIAQGYLAAGPAIRSKVLGPVVANFQLSESPGILDTIMETLTGDTPVGIDEGEVHEYTYTGASEAVFSDFALMYMGSDLDLHCYDSSGNHVGINYETGALENGIPGAVYSGSNAKPETIRIPNQGSGSYRVEVVAVSTDPGESYQVTASGVPDRPARIVASPAETTATIEKGVETAVSFEIAVREMGGQRSVTGLEAAVEGLTGPAGQIPDSAFQVTQQGQAIPAGDTVGIKLEVTDLAPYAPGTYTGTCQITGVEGDASAIRKAATAVPDTREPFKSQVSDTVTLRLEIQGESTVPAEPEQPGCGCFQGKAAGSTNAGVDTVIMLLLAVALLAGYQVRARKTRP